MAGLYVHIPFCHSKCAYCDFYSTPDRSAVTDFFHALAREYQARSAEISEPFTTIYFGGGTPSIVDPALLASFVSRLPLGNVEEFTIEVNPEDVTPERIRAWRDIGVNRVSMGIQSFVDDELRQIRRRHSAADALRAVETLRGEGISNISCDLIYGLPVQTLQSWQYSLDMLLSLKLPHLSAYCLSYEPGTALSARVQAGKLEPTDDDTLAAMYRQLCQSTAAAGYEHYEISNFSLPGMRSRHNSSYWRSVPYLGLGPGAHSFDGLTRRYNPSDLRKYINHSPIAVIDEEDDTQRYNDLLITALRTSDGLDLSHPVITPARRAALLRSAAPHLASGTLTLFPSCHAATADDYAGECVLKTDYLIVGSRPVVTATYHNSRLRITEPAWFISDSILLSLIE